MTHPADHPPGAEAEFLGHEVSGDLVVALKRLGDEHGPLGVALAAAGLSFPNVVKAGIDQGCVPLAVYSDDGEDITALRMPGRETPAAKEEAHKFVRADAPSNPAPDLARDGDGPLRERVVDALNNSYDTADGPSPALALTRRHTAHFQNAACYVCQGDVAMLADAALSVVQPELDRWRVAAAESGVSSDNNWAEVIRLRSELADMTAQREASDVHADRLLDERDEALRRASEAEGEEMSRGQLLVKLDRIAEKVDDLTRNRDTAQAEVKELRSVLGGKWAAAQLKAHDLRTERDALQARIDAVIELCDVWESGHINHVAPYTIRQVAGNEPAEPADEYRHHPLSECPDQRTCPTHPADDGSEANCGQCYECVSPTWGEFESYMVICPECGNKRCPHATWHGNDCTGSNESGQPGSQYHPDYVHPEDRDAADDGSVAARTYSDVLADADDAFLDDSSEAEPRYKFVPDALYGLRWVPADSKEPAASVDSDAENESPPFKPGDWVRRVTGGESGQVLSIGGTGALNVRWLDGWESQHSPMWIEPWQPRKDEPVERHSGVGWTKGTVLAEGDRIYRVRESDGGEFVVELDRLRPDVGSEQ